MKKITILLLLSTLSKAQTPIINNLEWNGIIVPNSYLKDTGNNMNQYAGTYIYQNNGVYFKIILKKVIMVPDLSYYSDMIVGEFEYLDYNDAVSTLSFIDTIYDQEYRHRIAGTRLIYPDQEIECEDCLVNELRMNLKFNDTRLSGDIVIRRKNESGIEVLKVFRRARHQPHLVGTEKIKGIVPDGEYTLIKQ